MPKNPRSATRGGIVPGGTQCVAGEESPAPASAGPNPHGTYIHICCLESSCVRSGWHSVRDKRQRKRSVG
eukprot:6205541-Heterocapsa_arctica.AAC.1